VFYSNLDNNEIIWVNFNSPNEIGANWDNFIQMWVKLKMFP